MKLHERNDPQFADQIREASEEGIQLLHDVAFKAALEGQLEPVYWQGQVVGQIRKIDNRLRIEMLRAHMPQKFKTPGTKVAINSATAKNNTMIVDEAERDRLIALRRELLRRIYQKRGEPVPAELQN